MRAARSPLADQPRTSSPRAPPLVGRARESVALRAALAAALAGSGRLVLVAGEAGLGKTALAAALGREATRRGALALAVACYDLGETPPCWPCSALFARPPAPPAAETASRAGAIRAVPVLGGVRHTDQRAA